jgi:hypothetical protein
LAEELISRSERRFGPWRRSPHQLALARFAHVARTGAQAPCPTADRSSGSKDDRRANAPCPQTSKRRRSLSGDFPQRGQGLGAFQRCQSGRQAKVSPALTFLLHESLRSSGRFFGQAKIGTKDRGGVLDPSCLIFLSDQKNEPQKTSHQTGTSSLRSRRPSVRASSSAASSPKNESNSPAVRAQTRIRSGFRL